MGFFSFDFDQAKGHIQISDQCWIWFAFTLPLTVLTLGMSYFWMRLKDPNRQHHVSPADGNLETPEKPEKPEKPTSKRSSVSSIASKDIEKFAEFLELLEQAKKGKSTEPKPLPSVPPLPPPKSQYNRAE